MNAPINPDTVRGSGRRELPAYVSNGLIGLRVRELPLTSGMTLVSSYIGQHYERQIEAAAVAPYPIADDIALDGIWLSDVPRQTENLEQDYDFSSGELTSRFDFRAGKRLAKVEVVTFCGRYDPTLICQEVGISVDAACALGLRAIVDASGADGRAPRHSRATPGEAQPATDGTLLWESAGALSTCGIALVTQLLGAGDAAPCCRPSMARGRPGRRSHPGAEAAGGWLRQLLRRPLSPDAGIPRRPLSRAAPGPARSSPASAAS